MTAPSKAAREKAAQMFDAHAQEIMADTGQGSVATEYIWRELLVRQIQHVSDVVEASLECAFCPDCEKANTELSALILPDDEPEPIDLIVADLCPSQGEKGKAAKRLRESLAKHGLTITRKDGEQ